MAAGLLPLLGGQAWALCETLTGNVILNCGAEAGTTSWTAVGVGAYGGFPNSGTSEFGMSGGGAASQNISQTVNLSASSYTLSFFYKPYSVGGTSITLNALFNGTNIFSASATATASFTRYSTTVTGTSGANTLRFNFTSTDTNNGTYIIDDVSLAQIVVAPVQFPIKLNVSLNLPNTSVQSLKVEMVQQMQSLTGVGPNGKSLVKVNVTPYAQETKAAEAYAAIDASMARPTKTAGNWQAWASISGSGVTSPTPSGANTTSRAGSILTAVQYIGFADTTAGVALGGSGANWGVGDGSGSGDSKNVMLSAFANHWMGNSYVGAVASVGHLWAHTNRTDLTNGETFESRFEANSLGGRLELGHQFTVEKFTVTPYVAGQLMTTFMPAYTETVVNGTATNATAFTSGRSSTTRGEIGSQIAFPLAANATATGKLAWAHEVSSSNVAASFLIDPSFSVVGDTSFMPKDFALVSAGATWSLSRALRVGLRFDGQFGRGYQGYAGTGTLTYALN